MNRVLGFVRDIYLSKALLIQMAQRDITSRYLGSGLGVFWAFVQPLITICVMWFVFEVGFKAAPTTGGYPFILWLLTGMIPWFFVSDSIAAGTHSILGNSSLVTNLVFRISLLPIVKVASAFAIHCFFVIIIILALMIKGFMPTWHYLQLFYYCIASCYFLLGLLWLTSSIVVFFKDLDQIISASLQVLFWATPIFWNLDMAGKYANILRLNPIYYITHGYRNTFINQVWFWQEWKHALYFWGISTVIFILGIRSFKKLKPHFADVL